MFKLVPATLRVQPPGAEAAAHWNASQFKNTFGIEYLSRLTYADLSLPEKLTRKCRKALKTGWITRQQQWLGAFYKTPLKNETVPPLTIGWINEEMGYGVFADAPLAKEAFVGAYTGMVRRRWPFDLSDSSYCFQYPALSWLGCQYKIDASHQGNYTRFINHSDMPNCEAFSVFDGELMHIILRAIRAIPSGAQLTMDYGPIYWRHRKKKAEG